MTDNFHLGRRTSSIGGGEEEEENYWAEGGKINGANDGLSQTHGAGVWDTREERMDGPCTMIREAAGDKDEEHNKRCWRSLDSEREPIQRSLTQKESNTKGEKTKLLPLTRRVKKGTGSTRSARVESSWD